MTKSKAKASSVPKQPVAAPRRSRPRGAAKARRSNAEFEMSTMNSMAHMSPLAFQPSIPKVGYRHMIARDGADASVAGCDYVGSVASSAAAVTISAYVLNPGNTTLFPRLSAMADTFMRYRFRKLRAFLVGRASATQSGLVSMASIAYELGNPAQPTTQAEVNNIKDVSLIKPWGCGSHDVDLKVLGLQWNSVDGTAGTGDFSGRLWIATPQTAVAGDITWDLWIMYDVDFAITVPTTIPNLVSAKQASDVKELRAMVAALKSKLATTSDV